MSVLRILRELLPPKLRQFLRESSFIRSATVRNESFYCKALAGESDTNITINSDMTVSCNCQDFDGFGHIGDLNTHSIEQIFSGPIACKFREILAARKFPTPICEHCAELNFIPSEKVEARLSNYRVPYKGIQVENTAHCNLRCGMCDRKKILGLRSGKHSLQLSDFEKISLLLKEHCFQILHYFNLGEPFFSNQILQEIKLIRKNNPDIKIITSTNGQLLSGGGKIEAALMMDYIGFCLSGVTQETVEKYQIGGQFDGGYQNMVNLVAEKNKLGKKTPVIEWRYVLFRWNDHPRDIDRAIELAKNAGVDLIGFYRGEIRHIDRSRRWYYHPIFKRIGNKSKNCVLVNLNNIPPHMLCP